MIPSKKIVGTITEKYLTILSDIDKLSRIGANSFYFRSSFSEKEFVYSDGKSKPTTFCKRDHKSVLGPPPRRHGKNISS